MTHLLAAGADVKGGEAVTFWILGFFALLGAVGTVAARNAVHSALFLVVTMMSLGVFYIEQAGPFIGFAQIIVYTGAIMMLFLFVLMLVGVDSADSLVETLRGQRIAAREVRKLEAQRWAVLGELTIDAVPLSPFASLFAVAHGLITEAHEYLSEESLLRELDYLP